MAVEGLVVKAAHVVLTGVAGAVVWDGAKKVARGAALRSAAVTVASWGLRGARAAEVGAEKARLAVGDIVSEARGRLGEQSPPPASAPLAGHDAGHQH